MMRTALAVLMFGLTLIATAAANPIAVELYVDFDPPNHVESIYPVPYETVFAYVVADIGYITGEDVYSVSFDVEVPDVMPPVSDFVPADPSYTVLGIVGDGITVGDDIKTHAIFLDSPRKFSPILTQHRFPA